MRRFPLIAGLALMAISVSGAAAAQPKGLGTVAGQVLGLDGKAIAGARVTLQAAEGHHVETAETNQQGRFWFASLPEGQYGVRASYQGRVTEWRQNVWVAPGEQTNVVLHLQAKKPALSSRLLPHADAAHAGINSREASVLPSPV
jgi:hypothetical protein